MRLFLGTEVEQAKRRFEQMRTGDTHRSIAVFAIYPHGRKGESSIQRVNPVTVTANFKSNIDFFLAGQSPKLLSRNGFQFCAFKRSV